jgi:hypothetical protein
MGMFRAYEIDSGLISIAATTAVPALYVAPTATNDTNLVRIKVSIEAGASPAPPSNGSVFFSLNLVTGTQAGGASVTPTQLSGSTLAARTAYTSGSTAITGLTQSTELWGGVVPFTAGAWAEDAYENTGLEINIPLSGKYCFYFAAPGGAGSGMNARVIAWSAE